MNRWWRIPVPDAHERLIPLAAPASGFASIDQCLLEDRRGDALVVRQVKRGCSSDMGVTILVPLKVAVPPPRHVERTLTPGA